MRILTWNAYGGNTTTLAEALTANQIDLCVLQEAAVDPDSNFYAPLKELNGYHLSPPVAENVARELPDGQTLAPADGVIRAYACLWRDTSVRGVNAELVNYLEDSYWRPADRTRKSKLEDEGYNQRPPLQLGLVMSNGSRVNVFTWHAPLAHWNDRGLQMFERSGTLAAALRGPTAIAGDMNATRLERYLAPLTARLQDQRSPLDWVLANVEPAKLRQIPGVEVWSPSHWALAADLA